MGERARPAVWEEELVCGVRMADAVEAEGSEDAVSGGGPGCRQAARAGTNGLEILLNIDRRIETERDLV